jgi:hypothetical protein
VKRRQALLESNLPSATGEVLTNERCGCVESENREGGGKPIFPASTKSGGPTWTATGHTNYAESKERPAHDRPGVRMQHGGAASVIVYDRRPHIREIAFPNLFSDYSSDLADKVRRDGARVELRDT